MSETLFERICGALSGHLDESYDSADHEDVARDILQALQGATAEEMEAARIAHPPSPSISLQDYVELLNQREADLPSRTAPTTDPGEEMVDRVITALMDAQQQWEIENNRMRPGVEHLWSRPHVELLSRTAIQAALTPASTASGERS